MNEVGNQFRFPDEVIDELLLVGVILPDDFDRKAFDEAPGAELFGLINHAHAALKYFANDLVVKLVLDREKSHEADVDRKAIDVKPPDLSE